VPPRPANYASSTWLALVASAALAYTLFLSPIHAAAEAKPSPATPQRERLTITPEEVMTPWTGDLDGMIARRVIRVLTVYSKTFYFVDKGIQRGTTYDIGCRWTGADGEEDLAPYSISIFVNGVKGTDGLAPGIPTSLPAAPYFYIGSDQAGANNADGWFKHFVIGQSVFSDEEIADLP